MIRVEGLSKKFKLYARPRDRIVEWISAGKAVRHVDFWALRDVSFDVRRGECMGVIGVNGSGKSTLLKILSGAMYPTAGTFQINGRVLSLLELGTGLNPELTGRQNILHSARLLAFDPDYATTRMQAVEAFAELGEFFDRPIRLYSSGMLVRLVFSMFAHFDPDVFIVDEALSVGDLHFQQKCAARINDMLARGVTMLFVSHDLAAVAALCDRVVVLDKGAVLFSGEARQGIQLYYSLVGASLPSAPIAETHAPAEEERPSVSASEVGLDVSEVENLPWQAPDTAEQVGDGRVRIVGICYRREDGIAAQVVERGQAIEVFVRYEALADVGPVNCGLALYDRLNRLLFAVNWLNAELEPLWPRVGEQWVARYRIRADLEPDEYAVWLGASVALRDEKAPKGWNQHLGGDRFIGLPRAGKIAVLAPSDNRRKSFGPANLEYEIERAVVNDRDCAKEKAAAPS